MLVLSSPLSGWRSYGLIDLSAVLPRGRWMSIQMGRWSDTIIQSLWSSQPPRTIVGFPFICNSMWSIQLTPTCSAPYPTCRAIQCVRIGLESCSAIICNGLMKEMDFAHCSVCLWHPPSADVPHVLLRSPCNNMTLSDDFLIWSLIFSCTLYLMNSIGSRKFSCSLRNFVTLFHSCEFAHCSIGRIGKYVERMRILCWFAWRVIPVSSPMLVKSLVNPVVLDAHLPAIITSCPPTLSALFIALGTGAIRIWMLQWL